jgi:hypothetical protein
MEIFKFLRKTLSKISNGKKSVDNSSMCSKCSSNDKQPIRYCKCCGKKLIKIKQKPSKEKSVNGQKILKLKHQQPRVNKPKFRRSLKRKNGNLKILTTDLFAAKKTYKMNNFCVQNYHIANIIPSNDNEYLESQDVANLVCIKPKVGFNKKGMFFCN